LLNPDSASDACMYVGVKIHVQSSKKSTQALFSQTNRHASAPMIEGCNPHDSPTFLHGRPETVSFDILFN